MLGAEEDGIRGNVRVKCINRAQRLRSFARQAVLMCSRHSNHVWERCLARGARQDGGMESGLFVREKMQNEREVLS